MTKVKEIKDDELELLLEQLRAGEEVEPAVYVAKSTNKPELKRQKAA